MKKLKQSVWIPPWLRVLAELSNEALTSVELSEELDIEPKKLWNVLKELRTAGLIRIVGAGSVDRDAGPRPKVYAITDGGVFKLRACAEQATRWQNQIDPRVHVELTNGSELPKQWGGD